MTVSDDERERERVRAESWVFRFMLGEVKAAAAIEQAGPPIRPSAVVAAVMTLLADERLTLTPISQAQTDGPEGD